MTKLNPKRGPIRGLPPHPAMRSDFNRRNFTFAFSSELKDWMGKSDICKKAPNKF